MLKNDETFEFENVNGVALCLKMDSRKGSPKSKHFTISYKNKEKKSPWPKISLLFAVLFNIVALSYVRISITAISVIVIVLSFLLFFWITHSVQSESLLVIPTVGIQSSVKYVYGREDHFVPWSSIDDVIINEVLKLNRVLYFLTVLVKSSGQANDNENVRLIPLFKYTKPRLVMLEKIYSELQTLLVETRMEGPAMGSGDTG
ncbi:phosphatidylinositol N-acetylglucosaminyltransferase subunit H-like [Pectinophora gossypiella]|nr:phosphatidylinositol N-acetylglucosaminyltransferase subunit H-like [Pectinophora gossypiella]